MTPAEKAKAIYERRAELDRIAKENDCSLKREIEGQKRTRAEIRTNEEYQELMNAAEEVHAELQKRREE